MTTTRKQPHFDTECVLQRMHDLGLSQRAVARRTGLPISLIAAFIKGRDPEPLRWRDVSAIATALDVDVRLLLRSQDTAEEVGASDDVILEAALLTTPRALAAARLCEALGWDLQRLLAAADALDVRLRQSGLELLRQQPGYRVVSRTHILKPSQIRRLSHAVHRARRGLRKTAARVLRQVIIEPPDHHFLRTLTNDEHVALGELKREGIIEWDGTRVALSDDVIYGLELTLPRIAEQAPAATPGTAANPQRARSHRAGTPIPRLGERYTSPPKHTVASAATRSRRRRV